MVTRSIVVVLLLAGCAGVVDEGGEDRAVVLFPLGDPRVPSGFEALTGLDADNATAVLRAGLDPSFPFALLGNATMIAESTGRELSLAIDPNDPARMIACSPTGTSVVGIGYSDVWLTLDGGLTWKHLNPEPNADTRSVTREGGDCDVAIGPDGTLYVADTWLANLSVARSDDGEHWVGRSVTMSVPVVDRPWLHVDAGGTLHITYQDVQALMPSAIWYTRTADRGETYLPSVPVAHATPEGAFTWTGNLVSSDDGQTIHSIYTRREAPVTNNLEGSGAEQLWVAKSTDGGLTWSSTLISPRAGPSSFLYPALARDTGGILYATFSEFRGDDQPTFWTRSDDDGASWTEPVAFLEGIRSGAPWVTAGASGAAFQFLGTPDVGAPAEEQRWWFYWATLAANATSGPVATSAYEPIHIGAMAQFPEFNMIRADAAGAIHIAGVAPWHDEDGPTVWRPYHQAQVGGSQIGLTHPPRAPPLGVVTR